MVLFGQHSESTHKRLSFIPDLQACTVQRIMLPESITQQCDRQILLTITVLCTVCRILYLNYFSLICLRYLFTGCIHVLLSTD